MAVISVDPKSQFLALEDAARQFRDMASGGVLPLACTYALSQFALTGVSADELTGAKKFLGILLNLGEKPVPPGMHPVKGLAYAERSNNKTET